MAAAGVGSCLDTEVCMSHWATAPLDRHQAAFFAPTLDDHIAADHPVRLFDEVLRQIDFADWEASYVRVAGQPPIHPRVMAAGILYGLSLGIRSSRKLEEASINRLDFIWLLQGQTPDHATFCKFRTDFGDQLKGLFRRVGRVAMALGMVNLNQVTLDGTAVRSCNSRFNTARRASLEQKLAALDQQVEAALAAAAQKDQAEDQWYGAETLPAKLPRSLHDMKRRQEQLRQAMKNLAALEADRAARGERKDLSSKGPAVPLADPQSRVLPNKEGGYAPNYTAIAAVDSAYGIIVDTQVWGSNEEAGTVLPTVANIEENLGAKPAQLAADSGFNSGPNLSRLEAQGVEALMPAKQEFKGVNPAQRPELSQPVAAKDWAALPINPQHKILDKAAFVYEPSKDQYVCPMSRRLLPVEAKAYNRHGVKGTYQMYQCVDCAGCPLAPRCLPKNAAQRRVSRDEHEAARERMKARMDSPTGRAQYRRRAWSAETPFALLKTAMNFRRFLLRGLKKVGLEWCWAATAYNLKKLMAFKFQAARVAAI
jgi:transposase